MSFGMIHIVVNEKPSGGASTTYNAVCVYNEFGEYETLLLTEKELSVSRYRAEKNPEDTVQLSATAKLCLRILRFLGIL